MYFKSKILSIFFVLSFSFACGQISSKKCKWIKAGGEGLVIEDSLSILPSSLRISYPADSSLHIQYDINTGKARLRGTATLPDSVMVCYSVLPYRLGGQRYHRNPRLLDSNNYYREDFLARRSFAPVESREEIFSSPGLNKTGSLSRGISFGNNQNVFVNSALNLQLDGRLTDDLTITAAISDQNIPFQPEGNTQQLQEFDKVYVQIKSKKGSTITAGDIVFKNKPSYFLRYYKNVQGGLAEVNLAKDSLHYSSTTGGVAISKGKFTSMMFAQGQQDQPIEGVQGPYRLRGPNNERFITVLANSERVYLDGRLLTRGFDYDYVIDYNQAEVTFTNNILITRYSVIRIDFEYTERNYSRVILQGSHYQTTKNAEFFVNFYQEKDNPRNPLTLDLSNEEKVLLSNIGDTLSHALISGADSVGYSSNKILYRDSAGIYVYSTSPDNAWYEVSFSDVGQGKGRYVLSTTASNGRVYKYAGPGLGRYEPVRNIPAPRLKQMATAGASYKVGKNDKFFFEFARSTIDSNLFSPYDDGNNGGNALKAGYVNNGRKFHYLKNYRWLGGVDYEYNAASFVPIDRFRDPNFERDWSSNPAVVAANHIINGNFSLVKDPENTLSYRISRMMRGQDVNGVQHYLTVRQTLGRLTFSGNGFLMFNNRYLENSDWRRVNTTLSYKTRYVIPGVTYAMDKNKVIADSSREVVRSAMYFEEVKFFLRNNDSLKSRFFADYSIREDRAPFGGVMARSTRANTANAGVNTRLGNSSELNSTFTYRYLQHLRPDTVASANEETVLGRIDWNSDLFKNHVRSEVTVTTGTGRELKRQFIYILVPVGEGTHYWKDLNNDGVQQLDEFFEAIYTADKQYIKSYIPTDEYIRAYTNSFSYRLDISAPRNWRNKGKLKSVISRLSNISSWTVNKRILNPDILARFLPTVDNIPSEDILSVQKSLRSALFFNRSNPKYGLDLNYSLTENKQLLTQGFENRTNEDLKFNSRVNIRQLLNFRFSVLKGTKTNESDFLSVRNFDIKSWRFGPELSYQPKNNLRFTLSSSYMNKVNTHAASNHERLDFYEGGVEVKVNKVSRRTINGNVKYIKILTHFHGTPFSSAIGYEMLEALQPGNNFTWNITWQERLSNGLQLSFTYEGRKSDNSNMIHIGRMQVSALF